MIANLNRVNSAGTRPFSLINHLRFTSSTYENLRKDTAGKHIKINQVVRILIQYAKPIRFNLQNISFLEAN